jgi:hypothetical protein
LVVLIKKENYAVITLENVRPDFFFGFCKECLIFKWIADNITVAKKKPNKATKNASKNHWVVISGVDT